MTIILLVGLTGVLIAGGWALVLLARYHPASPFWKDPVARQAAAAMHKTHEEAMKAIAAIRQEAERDLAQVLRDQRQETRSER